MELAQPPEVYLETDEAETPLEAAARAEAQRNLGAAQVQAEEQEADTLMADIDEYVAQTDPASLPEAERALNAWQIPTDPLEGVPSDAALEPGADSGLPVAVFAAQSESEANIVRGLLEASGIPALVNPLSGPALGGIFQPDETRWGDILVSPSDAEAALAAISEATRTSAADQDFALEQSLAADQTLAAESSTDLKNV